MAYRPFTVKRRLWIFPVSFLALALIGLGSITWMGNRDYERELDRARKAGLIVAPEDLAPPSASPSENAAGHYQTAVKLFRAIPSRDQELVLHYPSRTLEERKKYAKDRGWSTVPTEADIDLALKSFEPALNLLRTAVQKPKLDFQRDWSLPIMSEIYGIARLSGAIRVLAQRQGRLGDFNGAFENLHLLRRMAKQIVSEPTFNSYQQANALYAISQSAASRIAWDNRNRPEVVDRVRQFLALDEVEPNLKKALQSSLLENLTLLDLLRTNPRYLGLKDDDLAGADMIAVKLPQAHPRLKAAILREAIRENEALKVPSIGARVSLLEGREMSDEDRFLLTMTRFVRYGSGLEGYLNGVISTRQKRAIYVIQTYLGDEFTRTGKFPKELPAPAKKILDPGTGRPFQYTAFKDHCELRIDRPDSYPLEFLPKDYRPPERGPR